MLRKLSFTLLLGGARPDAALLVLRLGFGLAIALAHGLGKMSNLERFIGTVESRGIWLPAVTGPAAALSEFVGGLLLAAGLLTRPAAALLLGTMLVAVFVVHAGDPFGRKELALAYACVSVVVLLAGPGRYSLDALWLRRGRAL
jgi:putative oxidoreductase